jgi:hypothetical protein
VAGCPFCMFYKECCGRSNARTLSFPKGTDPTRRLKGARLARSPEGRHALRERMTRLEQTFADIKSNKGMNRFVLRGEAGARIEWNLIHLARNLRLLGRALERHPSRFPRKRRSILVLFANGDPSGERPIHAEALQTAA